MRRRYGEELSQLSSTYSNARRSPLPELNDLIGELTDHPALFIASGGALAVALSPSPNVLSWALLLCRLLA